MTVSGVYIWYKQCKAVVHFWFRGEYTNLSEQADGSQSQSPAKEKQEQDNDNSEVASRGDAEALEGASREGLDNQPSLAFFPADKIGYIAKVSAVVLLVSTWECSEMTLLWCCSVTAGLLSSSYPKVCHERRAC